VGVVRHRKMAIHKRRLIRLLRCGTVTLLFVIVYVKRNIVVFSSIDLLSTDQQQNQQQRQRQRQQRQQELEQQLQRLDRLPKDSVHRVAFITFSYVKHDDASKLFDFLLPAVDTWAAPPPPSPPLAAHNSNNISAAINNEESVDFTLYVVFSHPSRNPFEKFCIHGKKKEEEEDGEGSSSSIMNVQQRSALCQRIQPIYVDCPEGKFGESPCCKQQKGLLELHNQNLNNNNNNYPLYDWYAFFDDDVYLRKEYVAKLLAGLQPPPDFPMAAIPYNQIPRIIGFDDRRCYPPYVPIGTTRDDDKNNKHDQFLYPWGMPIFYSRGALDIMSKGYRANSLVEQCAAFDVTHDVGNAILNWMYGLPAAMLPPLANLPAVRDDYIGSHLAGRDDMRERMRGKERLNRRGRVIAPALPEDFFSFYGTHERWMLERNQYPEDLQKWWTGSERHWFPNVTTDGFRRTLTHDRRGDPRSWPEGVWHTMEISDCDMGGGEGRHPWVIGKPPTSGL